MRRGEQPSEQHIAKYVFISNNPGFHPVQQDPIDTLTEQRLDKYNCKAFDYEHFSNYEFTDEETEALARFPETITLGSGLAIPEQTLYVRSNPREEKSVSFWIQRRSLAYFSKFDYYLIEDPKKE